MSAFYQLMGIMRRSFVLIFCLFWLCSTAETIIKPGAIASAEADEPTRAAEYDAIVQVALQQASELKLAQHDTWLALLHFKKETLLRRFISQVDDEYFFLDAKGNVDPAAELNANIAAFLSTRRYRQDEDSNHIYAQCLFPARWWWLKQQLNLADNYDAPCPKLDKFMARIAHEKLFLVFPSMYLNNPGSTFGHTFLRFDNKEESILLSQTLTYAARVNEYDDIVSHVSKGLFGGYRGFFRARPYFETVQEYSNIENRDIWEYQLDFSAQEIEQLVRHVWEIKGVNFDYYFFRENCAYRMLALLDILRPMPRLTTEGEFSVYAIPVDTVRALDDAGLIQSRKFRASLATQIDAYFLHQDDEDTTRVLQMASEDAADDRDSIAAILATVTLDKKKIALLNQSYTLLQFHDKAATQKAQNILALTNLKTEGLQLVNNIAPDAELVSDGKEEKVSAISPAISPEQGHNSMRMSAGYGEQNSNGYLDINFRPAFHDLLDAPQGYVDGAAINVFDVRLKWFESKHRSNNLRLESLSVFNVTSLSPLSRWQKPVSWLFDFRLDRRQLSDTQSVRNFISRGGVGFSMKSQSFMPFILLMGEWDLSSSYEKGHSLLLGLQAGLRYSFVHSQLMLEYEVDNAVSGFELDKKVSRLQWQYNIQINHAVRLLYKHIEYDFYRDEDWSLNYNYYF